MCLHCVSCFFVVISCSKPGLNEQINFCVKKKSQERNIKQNAKNRSAHLHKDTKKGPAIQANPASPTSQADPVYPASPATPGVYRPVKIRAGCDRNQESPLLLKISSSSEEPRFFLRSHLLRKISSSSNLPVPRIRDPGPGTSTPREFAILVKLFPSS